MIRVSTLAAVVLAVLAYPAAGMTLSSQDLSPNTVIPTQYIYPRCGGENVSPQLSWNGVPSGTKSLVLTMIDKSVKPAGWSHWIVVDLPASAKALARNAKSLPGAAKAIPSNFGDPYYDGPCPPAGSGRHVYEFTLWALPVATMLLQPDMKATELESLLAKTAIDHASFSAFVTR